MFYDMRLPDAITRGSRGGPRWDDAVVELSSGRKQALRRWSQPLHRYDISFGIKTVADFEAVRAVWYVCGRLHSFRYKDWNDYTASGSVATLVAGSTTQLQLQRAYTTPLATFLRDIKCPAATPAPAVYRTRGGATSLIAASVSTSTGIATISGHQSGDTYTWTGEFDVPVAFADNTMDNVSVDGISGDELLELPSIKLEEPRL